MTTKPLPPRPLTEKEKDVLEFIEGFIGHRGIAPTFLEIKENFGFASFNSVQRYLKQLQHKNYLHIPGDNQKRPWRFGDERTNGARGYSDHFPITVKLKVK